MLLAGGRIGVWSLQQIVKDTKVKIDVKELLVILNHHHYRLEL